MAYQFLDSRDIVAGFYPRYESSIAGAYFSSICVDIQSDRAAEEYKWVGQSPAMREWIGGRNIVPLGKASFDVRNKSYESTMLLPRPDLRRDKTGLLRMRVSEMADRAAENPQTLLAAVINANPLCYDGQNFYDTDHAEGSSGTQVNELGATQVPGSNVSDTAVPTAAEMAVILVQAIGHIYTIKDDKGNPMNGGARSFQILCSTSAQWAAATQAVNLTNLTSGASNPTLGLKANGISLSVVFDPRLTTLATNVQFVINILDSATKPFINQVELPMQTELIGEGSEFAFDNDAHKFGINESRAIAPGFWQKSFRVTLT